MYVPQCKCISVLSSVYIVCKTGEQERQALGLYHSLPSPQVPRLRGVVGDGDDEGGGIPEESFNRDDGDAVADGGERVARGLHEETPHRRAP